MYTFIVGAIIFFAVLLVLVILAQNAKGGGLTSQFGGSAASNIIGVKKTGDLLEKLTWAFIIIIMALSLTVSTRFVNPYDTGNTNPIIERAGEQNPVNSAPSQQLDLNSDEQQPASTDTAGQQ